MFTHKFIKSILFTVSILLTNITFAKDVKSIEFFSSNNTNIIDAKTAYERMLSQPQDNLKNDITKVLQKNHLEQNNEDDALGIYQMKSDQTITADNTKLFTTSPYQLLSASKAFDIAKELARTLKQESVAVFIPANQKTIGDLIVKFNNRQPSIHEVIQIIQTKLPEHYSQAFSMRLDSKYAGFENTKVTSIEWLGSHIQLDDIKQAFPQENIITKSGKAFLVYSNGQKQEL